MPVPKRKVSKRRRDKRAANWGIKPGAVMGCLTCQAPVTPHQVCSACGYYKGRKIIVTKTDKMQKKAEVMKAKQAEVAASAPKAVEPQG